MPPIVRYVLDTDHISLAQRGHPLISARILSLQPNQLAVAIVSVQEQMQGRLAQIQQAKNQTSLIEAYAHLHETVHFHRTIQVLDFDDKASGILTLLQQQRIRIGTLDLRIAAIALAVQATLVTRNLGDFAQVPGLKIKDWSTTT